MVDPEDLYAKLVSGSASTVRGQADTVGDAIKKVEESATRVDEAADRPQWTSAAAAGYRVRTAGVSQGLQVNRFALGRIFRKPNPPEAVSRSGRRGSGSRSSCPRGSGGRGSPSPRRPSARDR